MALGGTNTDGTGWNRVRRQALERDDYQCLVCGATAEAIGRNPDVHHIVPVRLFDRADDRAKTDAHDLEKALYPFREATTGTTSERSELLYFEPDLVGLEWEWPQYI